MAAEDNRERDEQEEAKGVEEEAGGRANREQEGEVEEEREEELVLLTVDHSKRRADVSKQKADSELRRKVATFLRIPASDVAIVFRAPVNLQLAYPVCKRLGCFSRSSSLHATGRSKPASASMCW